LSAPPEDEQYDAYVGRIARGAGISSVGVGIGRLLGYATQLMLARAFGPAQLGFYILGITLVQITSFLARLGMDNGVVRYVAYHQAEGDVPRVRGTILLALWVTVPPSYKATLPGGSFIPRCTTNQPLFSAGPGSYSWGFGSFS
jgi:hypothetical protein